MVEVNPACRRFLFEISRGYIWDGETNKPVKDNDDMMEDFYRLCLQGLDYIQPATENDYQPILAHAIPDNVLDFPESTPDWSFPDPRVEEVRRRNKTRYNS